VLVTPAGRALLDAARRVLLDADDLLEASRCAGDPLAGSLRIGVIPTVAPYLLPAAAPALRAAHPGLSVIWLEERTPALVQGLHAGALDAALVAVEAALGDVEREVVATDPFLLAAPAGHPLAAPAGRPATPGDLREASVLLLEDGHCLRDQALAVCGRARVHELEFRATSLGTLVQMVAGGAGVTLLPALAVQAERRAGLVLRPFADPTPHRTLALAWRRRSPLGPALRTLAGTIRGAYPVRPGGPAGAGITPRLRARSAPPGGSTGSRTRATGR
jgi:LysR family hydrogen peroxide-inducible transcriptional activator